MPQDHIRYTKNGDVHIAYEVLGPDRGVDLLCIRTFVSQLQHFRRLPAMTDFADGLGRLGRLICFDHRGTGLSDRVRGYRLPTIEERVDDLRVVLDAARCERAVIIALADGGPLGCMFAASHPERPRRSFSATRGPASHGRPTTCGGRAKASLSRSWRTSTATGVCGRWPRQALDATLSRAWRMRTR